MTTLNSLVIEKAKQVYLEHGGKDHRQIEKAMHDLGCLTFSRRVLYSRTYKNGKKHLGWVDKYGWRDLLSEPPAVAGGFLDLKHDKGDKLADEAETRFPVSRESVSSSSTRDERQETRDIAAPTTADSQPPTSFPEWLKSVSSNLQWDWKYQQLIYDKLNDVTTGKTKRLMIFLPPRHGKSELVTVRYSAWRLQHTPSLNIILGSYNQRLANRFSRKVRITWEDSVNADARTSGSIPEHSCSFVAKENSFENENPNFTNRSQEGGAAPASSNLQFPIPTSSMPSIRRRLNTVAEWETGLGGGVRAVGVGGGITGFGAGLVIIDDPVKSRAEAESKTYRDKVWEWFSDDLYTRLEPNAAIILIQTRWHEDDLAGRLLKEAEDGGEKWDVISLPALAEVSSDEFKTEADPLNREIDDALCPDRFSRDDLFRIKRQLGSYSFSALYQQRPTPPEGGLFKRKWFSRIVDRPPDGLKWVRAYDLAVSTSTSADYTASFRCALDKQTGELYIADGFRKRIEFPEQRKFITGRILNEPDTEHGIELALHGQAFIQDLRREHKLFGRAFRGIKVTHDKFTRALSWANLAEEGKVVLVRAPWIDDFLDEITTFPNSTHDDQLDAISLAMQMLEKRKFIAMSF